MVRKIQQRGRRADGQTKRNDLLSDRQIRCLADRGTYQLNYHRALLDPDNLQLSIFYFPRQEDVLFIYFISYLNQLEEEREKRKIIYKTK